MALSRRKTLVKYVVPTMLSCICFFLFTVVDGIFVGHGIGTNALGAVNIVFPYILVAEALFMLTTIGGVTVVAIRLGRGDKKAANDAFMHSVAATGVISVILCIAGTVFTDKITDLLGANETFHAMTAEYLLWYSFFVIPSGISMALQGFCRNDGSPVLVSTAVIISTLINVFGDWLCIFPLNMGLKGAALATGVSQTIALGIVFIHFLKKKGALCFTRFKPKRALFGKIFLRGLPECIAQLSTPVSVLCTNYVLLSQIGDIGVNTFSIISYVASFTVAIFIGAAEGLQPLIGRSYGARNESDMKYYFHAGLIIDFAGSVLINVLLLFIGGSVCALFGADEQTLAYTIECMPKYSWGFIIMSMNTMISSYLYSTKRSMYAIIINVLRSFVVDSAIILLLPRLLGGGIIWHTFGIYESIVLVVAVALLKYSERNGVNFH